MIIWLLGNLNEMIYVPVTEELMINNSLFFFLFKSPPI